MQTGFASVSLVSAAALLALAACGKPSNTIEVKDGDGGTAKVTTSGSTATITTDKGTLSVASSGTTASFTKYAPQYPGSQIVGSASMKMGMDGKPGAMETVQLQTSDAPDKVLAFYKSALDSAKLPISMQANTPEGSMIQTAGDASTPSVMVSVAPNKERGGSDISLMVMSAK